MSKTQLYKVLSESLNSKERTAKVYAASIRRIHREVFKKELDDMSLKFIPKTKTLNFLKKIVNLTRRKNAATALLMGLKAVNGTEDGKIPQDYDGCGQILPKFLSFR